MKIAVLGTGMVGQTIASKLVELGHDVCMGSRTADNEKAKGFVEKHSGASQGTYADAAAHAELVFNCTAGIASVEALKAAGEENLAGKVLIDVANPLDFSQGLPMLSVVNTDSLGEQIQREFPKTRVVKTLNTVNCEVMVDPSKVPGDHDMFICSDDEDAKNQVKQILTEWFGWKSVVDLGGIDRCRGMESYLPFWVRLWQTVGTPYFNIKVVKA